MKRRGGNCRDRIIPVALIAVIAVIAAALLAPTRERAFGDIAGFGIGDVTGVDLRLEAAGLDVELGSDEAAGLLERLWALECRGGAPQTAMQGPYARVRLYAGLDGCEVILAPGALICDRYGGGSARCEISSGAEELETFINGLA